MTDGDAQHQVLLDRLKGMQLFRDCTKESLAEIAAKGEWVSLPGGQLLIEQGAESKTLYVVLSGRLSVIMNYRGEDERRLSELGPGETVGEMGVITGAPRSASVIGLRDSELLQIPIDLLEPFMKANPTFLLALFGRLAKRMAHMADRNDNTRRPLSVALIPLDGDSDWAALAESLAEGAGRLGASFCVMSDPGVLVSTDRLLEAEQTNDLVLLLAKPGEDAWRQFCLRQADRIAFLASASAAGRGQSYPRTLLEDRRRCDLVILEPEGAKRPSPAARWESVLKRADWVHRLRPGEREDFERLARLLMDRANCLVLSGGGARGFAHLGVIRALRERGVPIDMVAGASMGAIVAAGCALEWDDEAMTHHFAEAFLKRRPTSDYTLPLLALLRGRRVSGLLKEFFGDLRTEDLWRPFYSVATDLTNGEPVQQVRGPLWRNLRASIAIPGLLPPVQQGCSFLGDGGVLANLPVDFLLSPKLGRVIAVDIAHDPAFSASDEVTLDLEQPFWKRWQFIREGRAPGIVSILLRAGTIGSHQYGQAWRGDIDLLLSPPLQEVGLLDWKAFEQARRIGYDYACERLDASGLGEKAV